MAYQFLVISNTQDTSTNANLIVSGYADTTFSRGFATTTFMPGGFVPIRKPRTNLTIQMANDRKALAGLGIVYDDGFLRGSVKTLEDLTTKTMARSPTLRPKMRPGTQQGYRLDSCTRRPFST